MATRKLIAALSLVALTALGGCYQGFGDDMRYPCIKNHLCFHPKGNR